MKLSHLAIQVLENHRRAPDASFYDISSLGGFFPGSELNRLDAAYRELVEEGYVEAVPSHLVSVGTHSKPTYRLRSRAGHRKKSA